MRKEQSDEAARDNQSSMTTGWRSLLAVLVMDNLNTHKTSSHQSMTGRMAFACLASAQRAPGPGLPCMVVNGEWLR